MKINDFQLSEHFNLQEFECPCCGLVKVSPKLIAALEILRTELGRPVAIESGFRCKQHQRALYNIINTDRRLRGKSPLKVPRNSLHTKGLAADIDALIEEDDIIMYERLGFTGIGWGTKAHLDVRDLATGQQPITWEYD